MNNENEQLDVCTSNREIRFIAMLCSLANLIMPVSLGLDGTFSLFMAFLISPILAILIWVTNREKHPFIDESAKNALNFTLSIELYIVIVTLSIVVMTMTWLAKYFAYPPSLDSFLDFDFTPIGIGAIVSLVIPALCLMHFLAIVYGSVCVIKGKIYKYPFTIRFFK